MKASKQYFPVVLLIMWYKLVLPFESVDEIQKCDHFNESIRAVLYHKCKVVTQAQIITKWKNHITSFPEKSCNLLKMVLRIRKFNEVCRVSSK